MRERDYLTGDEIADRRDRRRASWMKRYDTLRNMAVGALGGKCSVEGCNERDPRDLHIIGIAEVSKRWSQLKFYKRIVEAFRAGEDVLLLGKLTCKKCKFHALGVAAADRHIAKQETRKSTLKAALVNPTTGCFYWIAGRRVEEHRYRGTVENVTTIDGKDYMMPIPHPIMEFIKVPVCDGEEY